MGHPIPGTTPQLGTPKSPWIQKPNWPDWKNTPITLWLFWHLLTEVMESKVRFTQPLLNKMYPDLPLLWKPWPCLKIRFWFHGNYYNYIIIRACILRIFLSYFGRNDDFINSFWNLLTFTQSFLYLHSAKRYQWKDIFLLKMRMLLVQWVISFLTALSADLSDLRTGSLNSWHEISLDHFEAALPR